MVIHAMRLPLTYRAFVPRGPLCVGMPSRAELNSARVSKFSLFSLDSPIKCMYGALGTWGLLLNCCVTPQDVHRRRRAYEKSPILALVVPTIILVVRFDSVLKHAAYPDDLRESSSQSQSTFFVLPWVELLTTADLPRRAPVTRPRSGHQFVSRSKFWTLRAHFKLLFINKRHRPRHCHRRGLTLQIVARRFALILSGSQFGRPPTCLLSVGSLLRRHQWMPMPGALLEVVICLRTLQRFVLVSTRIPLSTTEGSSLCFVYQRGMSSLFEARQ